MSAANRLKRTSLRGATHLASRARTGGASAIMVVRWTTVVVLLSTVAIVAAAEENANTWVLASIVGGIWLFGAIIMMGIRFPGPITGFLLGEGIARRIRRGEGLPEFTNAVRTTTLKLALILLIPVGAAVWASAVPIVDRPEIFGGLILMGIFSVLAVIAPPYGRARRALIGAAFLALAGTSAWAYWDAGNQPVAWGILGFGALVALGLMGSMGSGDWTRLIQAILIIGAIGGVVYAGLQLYAKYSDEALSSSIVATNQTTVPSHFQCDEADWTAYGDLQANGYAWYEIEIERDQCIKFEVPNDGSWNEWVLVPANAMTWFDVEFLDTGLGGTIRCNDGEEPLPYQVTYPDFLIHNGSGVAVLWVWDRDRIQNPVAGQPCQL